MEVHNAIILHVQMENKSLEVQMLIVKNIDYDMVMGNDELTKHKIIIDYEKQQLNIQDISIAFNKQTIKLENKEFQHIGKFDVHHDKYGINNMNTEKENMNMENNEHRKVNNDLICPVKYERQIKYVLNKYKRLFDQENRIARAYVHKLEMHNIENFKAKNYPIPYRYRKEVYKELQEMQRNGIIEKCNSSYINPIVVVKKKNGDIRLCLDARNLNKCTVPQYEAPMNVDAIFGRITEAKLFTKLDLKHSFWLIPLEEKSRDYTGFSIDGVIYRFAVVPFGLQSACSALVRALHKILDKYEDFTLHYIDDILIFSNDENKHSEHIEIVLKELDNAGLKINLEKCKFYQKEVKYLGYKLNQEGLELDEERIKIIQNYKRPKNLKTLRGFIGMINYFKRLIPNISEKLEKLIELLKNKTPWKWTIEREEAFKNIKEEFSNNLKVYHPRYDKTFILKTDASIQKFAGVLLQKHDDVEVPICFVSRVTKLYERNYSASELELASIIFCINKLRFYLLGSKFIIETDHLGLTSIMENRYGNSRIHRWSLILQEYEFEIKYVPGKLNIVADALTREDGNKKENRNRKIGINIMKEEEGKFSLKAIEESQNKLSEAQKEKAILKENIYIKIIGEMELYIIEEELAVNILKELHEQYGHIGARKLWLLYRENYFTKNDQSLTKRITSKCKICQLVKSKNIINKNIDKTIIAKRN
ncbi:hypothetical protein WA026_023582 [Henosepilachna vigintioctopunctata]|uniref:RNA-directed DNA polymerase n=1 Tax=Henosepilachna vigintioctopunctata TaxID=420089 RepID=A0AAW1V2N6_9CUCU